MAARSMPPGLMPLLWGWAAREDVADREVLLDGLAELGDNVNADREILLAVRYFYAETNGPGATRFGQMRTAARDSALEAWGRATGISFSTHRYDIRSGHPAGWSMEAWVRDELMALRSTGSRPPGRLDEVALLFELERDLAMPVPKDGTGAARFRCPESAALLQLLRNAPRGFRSWPTTRWTSGAGRHRRGS